MYSINTIVDRRMDFDIRMTFTKFIFGNFRSPSTVYTITTFGLFTTDFISIFFFLPALNHIERHWRHDRMIFYQLFQVVLLA